jgi:uncharacterized membrane protein YfcA
VIEAALIGVVAGVVAGMLGVGGGVLFVPALSVVLGLDHVDAEATSLLAIVPVAAVGAWRQRAHGNVRLADAGAIGALALAGTGLGVVLANLLPRRALEVGFACVLLYVAFELTRTALRGEGGAGSAGPVSPAGRAPGRPSPRRRGR